MLNTSCIHRNFFFFFPNSNTQRTSSMYVIERSRRGEEKKNKQFFSNYSSGQGRTISFCKLSPRPVPSFDLINYYETIRSPLATSGLLIVSDPFTTIITRIGFIYLYIYTFLVRPSSLVSRCIIQSHRIDFDSTEVFGLLRRR